MTSANKEIQKVGEDGILTTHIHGYNDKGGPQRESTHGKEEQMRTIEEQDSPGSSNLETEKNEVKSSIDYCFQYFIDPIDFNTKANIYVSNLSKAMFGNQLLAVSC